MKDPWEKAYVYSRTEYVFSKVVHIAPMNWEDTLCGIWTGELNSSPKPYPVCKNCLRSKRAKELEL
jgi:hypothetical protein